MDLYLRKIRHPQARNNFRVILKLDEGEIEVGSIGINTASMWVWGIDTLLPMADIESEGTGKDIVDCKRRFKAAWDRFASDEANLAAFLEMKRPRR
jgi:hypothetical protein